MEMFLTPGGILAVLLFGIFLGIMMMIFEASKHTDKKSAYTPTPKKKLEPPREMKDWEKRIHKFQRNEKEGVSSEGFRL